MDFMSVGTAEILMIVLVALLVVGPTKVVGMARTLGRIMRSIKNASNELTSAVTRELEQEEREKQAPPNPDSPEKKA
jgi:Sec-independent protein translocase protein TatA